MAGLFASSRLLNSPVRAVSIPVRFKTTRPQEWTDKKKYAVKIHEDQHPIEETMYSKHKWMKVRWKNRNVNETLIYTFASDEARRSDQKEARKISDAKFRSLKNSLMARGFCRERLPYEPPGNVEEEVRTALHQTTSQDLGSESWLDFPLTDLRLKFQFLLTCAKNLKHEVPNSDLYLMRTVKDVVEFYKTPIRGSMSYDHLIRVQNQEQLPNNLHLIPEEHRFDPNSDFMAGISAFPGMPDDHRVGIRDKKKYPPLKEKMEWPDI